MSPDIAKCSFRGKDCPWLRITDLDSNSGREKKSEVTNNSPKDSQLKTVTILKDLST